MTRIKPLKAIRTQQTAGFSLIEVLVVIVMVGILAAIAAPSWIRYLNNQRVDAVQSDLLQAIRSAQQDAIQERTTLQVRISEVIPNPPSASNPTATVPIIEVGEDLDDPAIPRETTELGASDSLKPGMIALNIYTDTLTLDPDNLFEFDYQGLVSQETPQALPFVIDIQAPVDNSTTRKCVIVATLLGNLKTAEGDICNNPIP